MPKSHGSRPDGQHRRPPDEEPGHDRLRHLRLRAGIRALFRSEPLGALVTKGISLKPMAGNPPPRICETAGGMLNAIGLENVGVEAFIRDKLPFLVRAHNPGHRQYFRPFPERISGGGPAPGRAARNRRPGDQYLLSQCSPGGLAFGADPRTAARVVARVRQATRLPLITKLAPQVTDIGRIARAVEEAGSDALSLINTIPAMAVDIHTRESRLGRISGGLSGPAIKPVALRLVYQAVQAVNIPVIGLGGIRTAEDALEFLLVGARAVQVGTANFLRPTAALEIIKGIQDFLFRKRISKIDHFIGTLQPSGEVRGPETDRV